MTRRNSPFDTSKRPAPPPRRRWRLVAALTSILLALVFLGGTYTYRHTCAGRLLPVNNLHRAGGECVGWVDDGKMDFGSSLAVADMLQRIRQANVDAQATAAKSGTHVVRIGLVTPLTFAENSARSEPTIVHSLEGTYVAQKRFNSENKHTQIAVIPMNEGRNQTHWSKLIPGLKAMRDDTEQPLIGVMGLGVSRQETVKLSEKLAELKIPAVGGVVTAIEGPLLRETSPSNEDYVTALGRYVEAHPELKNAGEVVDLNGTDVGDKNDKYVARMHSGFVTVFGKRIRWNKSFRGRMKSGAAPPNLFDDIVNSVQYSQNVTWDGHAGTDMLLFGGRSRDLPALVKQLAGQRRGRQNGGDKPLVILATMSGVASSSEESTYFDHEDLVDGNLTVVLASSSDAGGWRGNNARPPGFNDFYKAFTDEGPFQEHDLDDGYALGHHDAFMVLATAVKNASRTAGNSGFVPAIRADTVLERLANMNTEDAAISGAGGELYYPEQGRGWPCGKYIALTKITGSGRSSLPPEVTSNDQEDGRAWGCAGP